MIQNLPLIASALASAATCALAFGFVLSNASPRTVARVVVVAVLAGLLCGILATGASAAPRANHSAVKAPATTIEAPAKSGAAVARR